MHRPPRPVNEPMLSPFVVWRVLFVSVLFLLGIFGLHGWALAQGHSEEVARTVAVNTLVCMEVFYLFSVRYLKSRSFTLQGVKGTPLVLAAVAVVAVLQLFFSYTPFMHLLFGSAALPLTALPFILAAGVAVFVTLELEKWLLRRWHGGAWASA
jgi:magnesium-transporting ATPase (P-type)